MKPWCRLTLAVVGLIGASAFLGRDPAAWLVGDLHRTVFPEQIPEHHLYAATARSPVNLATFVQQLRQAWPDEGTAALHRAAGDVATGLLHHADIEVGSLHDGQFVAWSQPAWQAARVIQTELRQLSSPLADETRFVFRRR